MSPWLIAASTLAIVVGAAHSYLGERYILMRLFRRGGLPPIFGSDVFTQHTLRFAWHITTVAWWGMAASLWALGHGSVRGALQLLAATFLASAVVTIVGSRGRHLAWIVFLAIAVAVWLGLSPA